MRMSSRRRGTSNGHPSLSHESRDSWSESPRRTRHKGELLCKHNMETLPLHLRTTLRLSRSDVGQTIFLMSPSFILLPMRSRRWITKRRAARSCWRQKASISARAPIFIIRRRRAVWTAVSRQATRCMPQRCVSLPVASPPLVRFKGLPLAAVLDWRWSPTSGCYVRRPVSRPTSFHWGFIPALD